MSSSLRLTDDAHFDADVTTAPLALVAFSGRWCPPCRLLEPTLAQLAVDRPELAVFELDVDTNQAAAQRYLVRAVPCLLLFRQGRVVGQLVGHQSRSRLEAWLETAPR